MKIIWYNGTLYTMESEGDRVEAILTDNGKIIEMGSYARLKDSAVMEINLDGSTLYPGFIDSHMHMIGHGQKLLSLDLSSAKSTTEMIEMLYAGKSLQHSQQWLIGEGWNENNFHDKKLPTLKQLDEITDQPMMLKRTCRHAILVNSKALALVGITKETPNPIDGVIERDDDGEATGYLHEGASEMILRLIPEPTEASLTHALETSVNDLLSLGLTGAVTDDLGYYGDYRNPLQAFNNIIGTKKNFRAHLLRRSTIFESLMTTDITYNEPWIEPGPMKFFIDGALGGRTALLRKPYNDAPENIGMAVHTDEEIASLVQLARNYNEAIAVHIIGDAATEKALDAIEKYPAPPGKLDRLIHVNVLSDDLVERMKKLPVVLDLQPVFVPSDFPWVMDRLGEQRLDWAYAWKSLLEHGFICGGGSDAPIEDVDPLLGIYAAITRRKPGEVHEGYLPKEKLSRFEALSLFTVGAAATIGKSYVRGKLAIGYDADFTVLDKDLFKVKEEEILTSKVMLTVVGGEIMYQSDDFV